MLSIYRDGEGKVYQTEHHEDGFVIAAYDRFGYRVSREWISGNRAYVQNVLDRMADKRQWRWIGCQGRRSVRV